MIRVFFIPDSSPGSWFSPMPDFGVNKAPDPRSGSATLLPETWIFITLLGYRYCTGRDLKLLMYRVPVCTRQGWKKPGFFLNPAQWFLLVFFWIFWGFLGFFGGFWGVFCPDERVFRVFSVSWILLGAYRL
jgi:hypothetical protein